MSDTEFDRYVAECSELVRSSAQAASSEYGIGTFERWDLDQRRQVLEFSNDSGVVASCPVFAVGSFSSGIWKWAWANKSLLPELSADSIQLKALEERTGMSIFGMESFAATEEMPWELSGMALRELGGVCVYKCSSGGADLYVVIKSVGSGGSVA